MIDGVLHLVPGNVREGPPSLPVAVAGLLACQMHQRSVVVDAGEAPIYGQSL